MEDDYVASKNIFFPFDRTALLMRPMNSSSGSIIGRDDGIIHRSSTSTRP